jgi:hypothetical protein
MLVKTRIHRTVFKWHAIVTAGYITSTVALQVVRGERTGTQCQGGLFGYPVPGSINKGT